MYDAGMGRLGLLGVVNDEELRPGLRICGGDLRKRFDVEEKFRKVDHPEPYYQRDDRVYRARFVTMWARPFEVEVAEPVGAV